MEDTVFHEQHSLTKYLASSKEPLLQAVFQCAERSSPFESPSKFKAQRKQHSWRAKPCMVS